MLPMEYSISSAQADDPGKEFPEAHIGVGVCAAAHRHARGELRIAQRGEPTGDPAQDEKHHHPGSAAETGLAHAAETTGADDGRDAEEGEVADPERPPHRPPVLHIMDLRLVRSVHDGSDGFAAEQALAHAAVKVAIPDHVRPRSEDPDLVKPRGIDFVQRPPYRDPMSTLRPFAILSIAGSLIGPAVHAQFGAEHQLPTEGAASVLAADLDGDSDNDLVGASRSGLFWFQNTDGEGTLGGAELIASLELFIHVDDLNGDGEQDICGSVDLGGGIRWYAGNGDGTFGPAQTISASTAAQYITTGDLDGDDDPDLVFVLENGDIAWAENTDGAGTFNALQTIFTAQAADHVEVVDLNSDPAHDLLWSGPAMGKVRYALNLGTGSFGPDQVIFTGEQARTGDVDGDGLADLVVFSSTTGSIGWQQNLDGSFSSTVTSIGTGIYQLGDLLVDDLDGDGDRDVATAERYPDRIVWYPNADGSGQFAGEQEVGSGLNAPRSLSTEDLDGDGDKELMAASVGQQMYVWYENLSQASFTISGRLFIDVDGNGAFGGPDVGLADEPVQLSTGETAFTTAGGVYWFNVAAGDYTIAAPDLPDFQLVTTASLDINIPATGAASGGNDFGYEAQGNVPDVAAYIATGPRKCGVVVQYWLDVVNTGNLSGDIELEFILDPLNTFLNAEPAAASQTGQVLTWQFPHLQPTHGRQVHLTVLMPSAENIGSTMVDSLYTRLFQGAVQVAEDLAVETHLITCSYDPNDKQVEPVGATGDHLVAPGQQLLYTIRFQNTGNAPAEAVAIVDTLDTDLNPQTLRVRASSHTTWTTLSADGVIHFEFPGIVLPDSASNEAESHGFVTFSVDPMAGIPDMTVADNAADIYFDLNPPVRTNEVFNTFADALAGTQELPIATDREDLLIVPNPMQETAIVHVEALPYHLNLMVINAHGQVLRSYRFNGGGVFMLRREGLPSGSYQVRVVTMQTPWIMRNGTLLID
jgi:uncharacterized repeat protein (TIGR01451 family)